MSNDARSRRYSRYRGKIRRGISKSATEPRWPPHSAPMASRRDGITALGIPPNQFDDLGADAFWSSDFTMPIRRERKVSKSQRTIERPPLRKWLCSTPTVQGVRVRTCTLECVGTLDSLVIKRRSSSLQSGWSSPSGCSQIASHRLLTNRSPFWTSSPGNAILIRNSMRRRGTLPWSSLHNATSPEITRSRPRSALRRPNYYGTVSETPWVACSTQRQNTSFNWARRQRHRRFVARSEKRGSRPLRDWTTGSSTTSTV